MSCSYVLVICIPTLEIAYFPKAIFGKSCFRNFPAEGTLSRAWAVLIKVCEMVWCHLLTHFLTQRQGKSKSEILIRFPPNQNTKEHNILNPVGIFLYFLLKVNSIFLNSTSISYLMFRHKTFCKQYTQWGPLWEIKRKRKKGGIQIS